MNGKSPLEGTSPTLSFRDHQRAAGHTGCRDYVASYRTTGGYFSYSVIDMVGADCPAGEALAEQENSYAALLGAAKDYRLLGDRLEIFAGQDETLVYEPRAASANAALMETTWTLRAFVQRDTLGPAGPHRYRIVDLLPETELTLTLGEGMAEGSAGCNTFRAIYRREGDFFSFSLQALNESRCEESIMEQERRFLDLLQDVTAYRIDGSQLWLDTENGQALVLSTGK
jgi:heat shock protein HslJ